MASSTSANRARFTLQEIAKVTAGWIRSGGSNINASFSGVCTDSRTVEKGNLFVALSGEAFDGHGFLLDVAQAHAGAAVVRRGASLPTGLPSSFGVVEVDDTLLALGMLAQAHRRRFPILRLGAITGSNGKTTTKELAALVLSATFGPTLKTDGNLNNEIGVPLTLFRLDGSNAAAVVEMGMNHAGEIARLTRIAEPRAGLVTCAQGVHLEGLGSVEAVARAKGELYRELPPDGVAVANLDDERMAAEARSSGRRLVTFGANAQADVRLHRIVSHDMQGLGFEVAISGATPVFARIPLVGRHNAMNASGALALGLALGGEPKRMMSGLAQAKGFSRRLELKQAAGGFTVLDDCYNANPASMMAAVRTGRELAGEGRLFAVLGDMLELGRFEEEAHREVGKEVAPMKLTGLVAFGSRARSLATAALDSGMRKQEVLSTEDPEEALGWLRARLAHGDLIVVKASRGTRLERIADPLVGAG